MFTEFNRIFSLEVDLKNLEVTYNSKALYTNVDLNTSTMMIKMSLDQNALDLTGKTVNAFIKTGIDKNITMQRCEILEATEGIIGLDFKSSALKAGTNTFFLEIKSNNEEIINSPLITYKVVELFDTYSSIEGDNNVSILTELITEVDIAKGSVEVLKNEIAEQERQREEAEASRKNNESSRIQAETNRTNSESTRVTNENNRKQAESTRESNETKRVNAENLRESAENTRKQEETKRSQNESLRVESEKERVLSYEEIKNNNAIFKEQMNTDFGNAKTDYFGEEHPNVVERLNSDFDNLHQRMNDSSLLQYEGTSIKADNSYYGLTKDMVVKGRTLQNLLPNLKSSSWRVRGSSLVAKELSKNMVKLTLSTVGSCVYDMTNMSMLKENTIYTLLVYIDTNFTVVNLLNICYPAIRLSNGYNLIKFTSREAFDDTVFLRIGDTSAQVAGKYLAIKDPILLEGDHTNTPIEELPFGEGIYSVGENEITEDGRYKISGKSCGKNLIDNNYFNGDSYTYNGITFTKNTDNSITCVGTATGLADYRIKDSDSWVLKPGNYVLSGVSTDDNIRFLFGGSYGDVRYNEVNGTFYYKFTIDKPGKMGHFRVRVISGKTVNGTIKIQLEKGDTQTPYEPYQESTYSYILEEPLRSLPNGVADTIEGNKVIRRVGKVVLDGSENIVDGVDDVGFVNTKQFFVNINLTSSATPKIGISNNFFYKYANIDCEHFYFGSKIAIFISKIKLATIDVDGFKQWLSQNPTTIYYELAEPIITELDETLQLKSYDGTTHITSDNYLLPITSAKIPSNVQAVVSSLINENKELTEEVSTLSVENEELKQTNEIQDELIDINMCATDEMYVLLEPLLEQSISTMSLEREVSKMVDLYVAMIQRGLKTIEQVPERYREQVREVLEQLEK